MVNSLRLLTLKAMAFYPLRLLHPGVCNMIERNVLSHPRVATTIWDDAEVARGRGDLLGQLRGWLLWAVAVRGMRRGNATMLPLLAQMLARQAIVWLGGQAGGYPSIVAMYEEIAFVAGELVRVGLVY